jgi:hypothetical protein
LTPSERSDLEARGFTEADFRQAWSDWPTWKPGRRLVKAWVLADLEEWRAWRKQYSKLDALRIFTQPRAT